MMNYHIHSPNNNPPSSYNVNIYANNLQNKKPQT
jgi:hypothetical protein